MSEWNFPVKPFGPKNATGGRYYHNNVGQFLDPKYYEQLGSEHPGVDFNISTGGDTDLGQPVYAVSKGIVVGVGFYRVWGNIVLIYHPSAQVWSMYAHLNSVNVKVGDNVVGKQQIGTIGKGDTRVKNPMSAHLHFEIRYKNIPINAWPSSMYPDRNRAQSYIRNNYVDGIKFLTKMGADVTW